MEQIISKHSSLQKQAFTCSHICRSPSIWLIWLGSAGLGHLQQGKFRWSPVSRILPEPARHSGHVLLMVMVEVRDGTPSLSSMFLLGLTYTNILLSKQVQWLNPRSRVKMYTPPTRRPCQRCGHVILLQGHEDRDQELSPAQVLSLYSS